MSFFTIGIKPNGIVGGERYFCFLDATDVVDAVMKFGPKLDAINDRIRANCPADMLDHFDKDGPAFMVCSIDYVDREFHSKEWEDRIVNGVVFAECDDDDED
jgi:hypothetical protein